MNFEVVYWFVKNVLIWMCLIHFIWFWCFFSDLLMPHFIKYLPYNPPENISEITNNDQICVNTIKNTSNPGFYHVKYDEKYMRSCF